MKFMVCYDDTATSQAVIETALRYAEKFEASLEIVYVMTVSTTLKPSEIPKAEEAFKEKINGVMKGTSRPYIPQMLISNEAVGDTLVEYATTNDYDRMFVGIDKKSKVGKLLMGSTAQTIILNAPCPTVTTK